MKPIVLPHDHFLIKILRVGRSGFGEWKLRDSCQLTSWLIQAVLKIFITSTILLMAVAFILTGFGLDIWFLLHGVLPNPDLITFGGDWGALLKATIIVSFGISIFVAFLAGVMVVGYVKEYMIKPAWNNYWLRQEVKGYVLRVREPGPVVKLFRAFKDKYCIPVEIASDPRDVTKYNPADYQDN